MGSCQTSNVIEMNSQEEAKILSNKKTLALSDKQNIQAIIDEQKQEFPDMEEWEGERYKGIGIKKMKGYKCNLQIDKLNQKRDEFWNKRNSHGNPNYKTWRVINQACVYDEYRANVLLEEYNLTTFNGCINHIVDKKGNHYNIPNYCINDPYFEREYKIKENIEKKVLKINLYEVANNTTSILEVSNLITGLDLKKLFCKKNNISFDDFNIRMFFSGMEISNEHFLYQYNIKNEFKIQVMRVPRPKTNEKKEEKNVETKEIKNEEKEEKKGGNKNDKESEEEEVINNNDGIGRVEE
jgi:hypothetical protein